ncbi:nuclear transport factor 2 family protein [Mesorhizobium sp. M0047]|uniref:nuclear transport factor 2 family protein n=1 Tax=Mesorhizobium sp. M0047 TaxID=2956859 RepID=UPI00333AF9A5
MKAALLGAALLTVAGAQTSFASPADEARIAGVISAVAVYADNRDFRPLERFFAPETTIDYTSLWGGESQRFAPSALMDAWADLLPGFDATRHELSDIQVEIGDGAATAQASVRATHWLGDRMWVVAGSYEYALIRTGSGWQVSRMTLHLAEESGDRTLVEEAAAKVARAK